MDETNDKEIADQIRGKFDDVQNELALKFDEKKKRTLNDRLDNLIVRAISFAQTAAGQRARFRLFYPLLDAYGVVKNDDTLITNVDDQFPKFETEYSNVEIWHLVKPGFVKFGTGMGQALDSEKKILVKAFVWIKHDEVDSEA
jgi:hypothetical protein